MSTECSQCQNGCCTQPSDTETPKTSIELLTNAYLDFREAFDEFVTEPEANAKAVKARKILSNIGQISKTIRAEIQVIRKDRKEKQPTE